MNIPNALTLARIILVPLIVWLIITHEMAAAFVLLVDGPVAVRPGPVKLSVSVDRLRVFPRSPTP